MTLPQFVVRRFAALAIQYRMLWSADSHAGWHRRRHAGCR